MMNRRLFYQIQIYWLADQRCSVISYFFRSFSLLILIHFRLCPSLDAYTACFVGFSHDEYPVEEAFFCTLRVYSTIEEFQHSVLLNNCELDFPMSYNITQQLCCGPQITRNRQLDTFESTNIHFQVPRSIFISKDTVTLSEITTLFSRSNLIPLKPL